MTKIVILASLVAALFVAFVVMNFVSKRRNRPTPADVARALEDFTNGTGSRWEWDDFISRPIQDPALEAIRVRCLTLDSEFPHDKPGQYCGEKGLEVLREYARRLRQIG